MAIDSDPERGEVRPLVLQAVVLMSILFLFPGVAVLLRRRLVLLWSATGIAFCLVLWFAVFAASVPEGILSAEYGYSLPLSQSLLRYGLNFGLGPVATAVAVQVLAGRMSSWFWLYVIGFLSAMAGALLGGRVLYRLVS